MVLYILMTVKKNQMIYLLENKVNLTLTLTLTLLENQVNLT